MSRRGGRKPSVSKELLKRSAAEAGLDNSAALQDITKPRLYPDFLWHSDGTGWDGEPTNASATAPATATTTTAAAATAADATKRPPPPSTVKLMNKQRELSSRFQTLYKDLHETAVMPTVPPDEALLQSFSKTNRKLVKDTRYFPEDLVASKKVKAAAKTKQASVLTKLEELESKEKTTKLPDTAKTEVEEEEGDVEPLSEEEEEELEADLDYTKDYYDTDDEDETGADDEAVY
jgi:hypothetical protein